MFLNVRYSCLKITLTKLIVKFDFSTDTYTHNLKLFYYLKLPKDIQTFKDLAQTTFSVLLPLNRNSQLFQALVK